MFLRRHFLAGAVALATVFAAAPSFAENLMVSDAWARASPGHVKAGAAFMMLKSRGEADRLVSASADVSETVELHTHTMDNGVMRMREVPAIEVPAGETVMLKPGGLHVMFIGLKAPLEEGTSFPVTLNFEKAGSVTVDVPVKGVGSMGHDHKHGHGHGHSH